MILAYSNAASRLATSLFVGGLIWLATAAPSSAQAAASDQIIHTLAPAVPGAAGIPLVRRNLSIKRDPSTAPGPSTASDPDAAFIEGLRHRAQSLNIQESDHV